jgi:hypothetical protein
LKGNALRSAPVNAATDTDIMTVEFTRLARALPQVINGMFGDLTDAVFATPF